MASDNIFMQRALELAELGRGNTSPNPLVGAVLVHNNRLIGEGYHTEYGNPHAEVDAINSVTSADHDKIKNSTLYVNLEPCSHHGKTPPCTDLILQYNIPNVVIGNLDPFSENDGKGKRLLEQQGVQVKTGVLQEQGEALNKSFFTFHRKQRPYIVLKWAQTANAIFAPHNSQQAWISGKLAQRLVHRWRGQEDAIMVGTETAAIDNPSLTCRLWTGSNPVRVVLDKHLRLSNTLGVFDQKAPTIVYTASQEVPMTNDNITKYISLENDKSFIEQILDNMHEQGMQSVLVEGGAELLSSMIKANLWDEARVFMGKSYCHDGKSAPQLPVTNYDHYKIDEDELMVFHNPDAA